MRLFRWIIGNIRKDRICKEDIRLMMEVVSIDEKMRNSCLR